MKKNKFLSILIITITTIILITGCSSNTNNELKAISEKEAREILLNHVSYDTDLKNSEIKLLNNDEHYKEKVCIEEPISEKNNKGEIISTTKVRVCDYDEKDHYYTYKIENAKVSNITYYVNHFSKQVYEIDATTPEINEKSIIGEFKKENNGRLQIYGVSSQSFDFILNIEEGSIFESFSGTAAKDVDGYRYIAHNFSILFNVTKDYNYKITVEKIDETKPVKKEHIEGLYLRATN